VLPGADRSTFVRQARPTSSIGGSGWGGRLRLDVLNLHLPPSSAGRSMLEVAEPGAFVHGHGLLGDPRSVVLHQAVPASIPVDHKGTPRGEDFMGRPIERQDRDCRGPGRIPAAGITSPWESNVAGCRRPLTFKEGSPCRQLAHEGLQVPRCRRVRSLCRGCRRDPENPVHRVGLEPVMAQEARQRRQSRLVAVLPAGPRRSSRSRRQSGPHRQPSQPRSGCLPWPTCGLTPAVPRHSPWRPPDDRPQEVLECPQVVPNRNRLHSSRRQMAECA